MGRGGEWVEGGCGGSGYREGVGRGRVRVEGGCG